MSDQQPKIAPKALAQQLLSVLAKDKDRLQRIDDYLHGLHDDPYMPANADDEYRLLARRSVSNWMPLLVGTPAQALYVDGFRSGTAATPATGTTKTGAAIASEQSPEWDHWQRSRMDSRQIAVHRGALTYGHSFTLTEKKKNAKGATTKGLSATRTAALYEDPANDDTPYAALTVTAWPKDGGNKPGTARMFDATIEYLVSFKSLDDANTVTVTIVGRHGMSECPITRFAAYVDLEGRTLGVIEPMIALQNRINQTVFDLLVAQTYGSFKVRYATGMAPPLLMDPVYQKNPDGTDWVDPTTGEKEVVDYKPRLDSSGNPMPAPVNANARRFLFAEDPDVKFGSLDETPLGGFIDSIDMSIRQLAAVSQTPPHYLLGEIANISAEALIAAETALARKVEEFRNAFGESWERVFRLAAELDGHVQSAEDFHGEVIWRDMESRSLAQSADALGKLKDQLGIPARGLWARVPGVTQGELAEWEKLAQEEDPAGTMADAVKRATSGFQPTPQPAPVQ